MPNLNQIDAHLVLIEYVAETNRRKQAGIFLLAIRENDWTYKKER
jgi:hypothetical protein